MYSREWVAVWGETRMLSPHNESRIGWEKGLGLYSMGGAEHTLGIWPPDWLVYNFGEVLNLRALSGLVHVKGG